VIEIHAESLVLGGKIVLERVSLSFKPGELAVICGPNGAGKTTLLRALAGLLPGMPVPDPRQMAYVPQGARSAWGMTVAQVASLGRIPHGDQNAPAVERALAACGIAHLWAARVDRISGGQARRAMLARAFATEPSMFLLDEPTADLDPAAQHAIMALLRDTARRGAGVVVVLHALELAQLYADRVVLLAAGRVSADGPPGAVLPLAAAAFGLPWGVDAAPRLLPPKGTAGA
jgi:iron complex transport system ATP-binding protein